MVAHLSDSSNGLWCCITCLQYSFIRVAKHLNKRYYLFCTVLMFYMSNNITLRCIAVYTEENWYCSEIVRYLLNALFLPSSFIQRFCLSIKYTLALDLSLVKIGFIHVRIWCGLTSIYMWNVRRNIYLHTQIQNWWEHFCMFAACEYGWNSSGSIW